MKNSSHKFTFALIIAILFSIGLTGCAGSEEEKKETPPSPPSATELMQKELNDLKSQNEQMKMKVAKLEQDNRAANAKATELETQLAEAKEKAATPPPLPVVQKPISTNARESYKQALVLFNSRNYAEAAALFQSALDGGIAEKMKDNCNYWLGECAFGEKKYDEAIEYFQKVFTFRISEKKDDSQLMIGNCYLAMGNKAKAKEAFERFTKKFPASPFIKRVEEKLGKL